MRKIFTLLSFVIFIGKLASAQDLSVIGFNGLASGCALTTNENVIIRIFNYGPMLPAGSTFNASYIINGGPPVTEMVVLPGNLLTNSTYVYTFTTQADLSAPGTYIFDASVAIAGDINPSNDAFTGFTVTNTGPSVGGTVSGGTNVCSGANSGNLTLSGHNGTVQNWEYSTDGGGTWISISNTTTVQSYTNLTVPTLYRAQVQNGTCVPATSASASMTINPPTVAGTIAGSATVCSGANTGNLTSTGRTGNILKWQFSTDGGLTWTDIANTTATQSYLNLTMTTRYRVQVQSGACPAAFSSVGIITVSPNTVAGTVSGGTTVCSGSNSGNLTLAGQTGAITRWEFSINAGSSWTNIANTTATQSYTNLTQTTWYRARVQSSPCAALYSNVDSIVVIPGSVGGTISSAATVCSGSNTAVLTLTGYAGTVQYWEFSTDGGATYTNIANTTDTLSYFNLTATTLYRANVINGTCPSMNSAAVTITVNPVSVGGTTSMTDTVCSGSNGGTITLSGHSGTILNWESSTDGITWTSIANTTTTQSYLNITATTYYRAVVQSGVCPAVPSTADTIMVDVPTVGGTVSASSNVCYGNNTGTLTLSGHTGNVVNWEYSIDGGINWVNISNTTTSYIYTNITLTTIFRAIVQNGTCSTAPSGTATLTVDPVSVGGTLNGSTTACGGFNSGSLDLISYIGTIQNWESSIDGGLTWTTIVNNTATLNYLNLPQTTIYRVLVKSGVCSNDTSSTATITVDPPSDGGLLVADDTVCAGSNTGVLSLSGFTGSIQHWESSTDGGLTWLTLANTTSSQVYTNLPVTTAYRVNVKSGVCNAVTSNIVTITVDPAAVGGSIGGSTTVCGSANSGSLTLSGQTGNILNWESSVDGGLTWTPIANTTATENYLNLSQTTMYRVIIASGVCSNDTSSIATITVDPPSDGGTLTAADTVCASANFGVLNLSGFTGTIQSWESSSDGGITWLTISNTTPAQVYMNLSASTSYRVNVKSGLCNVTSSNIVTITVDPVVQGGTLTGGTTVCDTVNSGTLTLTGSVGQVTGWESSTDAGMTWSPIANTTTLHNYTNLTDTTWFRVIVMSGVCGSDTSSVATVFVNPATVGGVLTMNDTVCSGNNTGTLYLTAYTGMILNWEYSIDGGFNWIAVSNTTDSLTYNNLTMTTLYRVNVQSGICAAQYSDIVSITVNPVSSAGMLSGAMPGCEGSNAGTLTLTGYAGSILNWNSSADGGLTWTMIANTTDTFSYLNLTDTTWFNVAVQSGVCPADTSSAITVIVYPKPVAMFSADTVCVGTPTSFSNASTISAGFIQFNQWDFGDGNSSFSVNPIHLYAVTGTSIINVSLITSSNFGCQDTAVVSILVNAPPPSTIIASGPLEFCSGDSVVLTAASGTIDYLWSNGDTTMSTTVSTTGTYSVTMTDTLTGCSSMASEDVLVNASPSVSAGADTTISLGTSVQLSANGIGIITWTWSPNTDLDNAFAQSPVASPLVNTTYTVTGMDVNGCMDSDSVMVTVISDYSVVISNLMTPNEDGYNDFWVIQNIENYPNTQAIVVNREGQEIFSSEAYDNTWNGTNKTGKPVPDGTYYYIIQFEAKDGEERKVLKGAITVLREEKK